MVNTIYAEQIYRDKKVDMTKMGFKTLKHEQRYYSLNLSTKDVYMRQSTIFKKLVVDLKHYYGLQSLINRHAIIER